MKFSGGKYGAGKYNAGAQTEAVWAADVRTKFHTSAAMSARVSGSAAIQSRFTAHAGMSMLLPAAAQCGSNFTAAARTGLLAPMSGQVKAVFAGNAPRMRTTAFAYMDLTGLVLNPGETLVIDTDSITVTKDGKNAIAFWQTGSVPFMLAQGENEIIHFDSNDERHATMTVTWRDRWI